MVDAELLLPFVWAVFVFYSASVGFWLYETVVLARGWRPTHDDYEWGIDDIQVRILTVNADAVVQGTVDALDGSFTDVRVIAEEDISVEGAKVHAVPEEFECVATNKGRALEWARRNVPCDREYVLYLDEDTIVSEFRGLPDADVVQFTELPVYTGSWLAYLAEVFRIGYQLEQRAFRRLRYPLYAWGGGIAVRHSLENRITWESATITEDTDFVWRAADSTDLDFAVVNAKFRNQAPPSLRGMFTQRRRWMAGTRASTDMLPRGYRVLLANRVVAWACSPLIPAVSLLLFLVPGTFPDLALYRVGSLAQFALLFVITTVGAYAYRRVSRIPLLAIPITPLLVVLNTAGALWGFLSPVTDFAVTEKVAPGAVEQRNPDLERGAYADHDVEEPFGAADD